FVLVKQALEDVTPFLFLALRFLVATAALLILFRGSWSQARQARLSLRAGAMVGVFLFAGYAFQTLGLSLTSASKSAFLASLSTVLVPLLGALVYQNRPHLLELAGVACATGGMGLMTLEDVKLSISNGDLLTLLCAVGFAAHIITLGHYSTEASFKLLS